jgi:adenosine deaminase
LTCLDLLGCERIDHGYFLLEDPQAVARCAAEGVSFTCAFTTSRRAWIPWRRESIRRMVHAGLRVTLGSDDPAMFPTTLGLEYVEACEQIGLPLDTVVDLAAYGIDASWMPDDDKARFRRELTTASGELRADLGLI